MTEITRSKSTNASPVSARNNLIYNDFVVRFANTNGTGSASANSMFARGLFRLGYFVGLKNIFPSNIQGMPTWFEIRVNRDGYTGRRDSFADLTIAMNPQTLAQDIKNTAQNGMILVDSSGDNPLYKQHKSDCEFILLPCADLALEYFSNPKTRSLFANMIYIGGLTQLFDIDPSIYHLLIRETLAKAAEPNIQAFDLGRDYISKNTTRRLRIFKPTEGKTVGPDSILITGNEAMALGCTVAGATVAAWYPITPSTSLMQSFEEFSETLRPKVEDKTPVAMIQAEDEIASIGMVLGASWMGARAFTATSGPGLSLMNEFLGFAYYAEIPTVLFNIQRNGPSTGMPTRTQQSDLLLAAFASHGDTEHVLLFPGDMEECYTFAKLSFDLAERLQTPVIVMGELEMGMNSFISRPFTLSAPESFDRGKRVLSVDQVHKLQEDRKFYRYMDYDKDGVTYRSFPGTDSKLSYFTRGSGHDAMGRYTEDAKAYSENLGRIKDKFRKNLNRLPSPVIKMEKSAEFALVYIGSTEEIVPELLDVLKNEHSITPSTARFRSYPFKPEDLLSLASTHKKLLVIEQNRDGQLAKLMLMAEPQLSALCQIIPLCFFDGEPLKAKEVADRIVKTAKSVKGNTK